MANEVPWSAKLPKCMVGDKAAEKGGLPHVQCPTCAKYSAVPHSATQSATQCHTKCPTCASTRPWWTPAGLGQLVNGAERNFNSTKDYNHKTNTWIEHWVGAWHIKESLHCSWFRLRFVGLFILDLRCTLHCAGRISWKDSKSSWQQAKKCVTDTRHLCHLKCESICGAVSKTVAARNSLIAKLSPLTTASKTSTQILQAFSGDENHTWYLSILWHHCIN